MNTLSFEDSPSVQQVIKNAMKEIVSQGNYESVFLLTDEGLEIARYSRRDILHKKRAVEISLLMHKVQKIIRNIGNLATIKEILVEDEFGKKLVFRFTLFFGQSVILVAIVPPRKPYRGFSNQLEQLLTSLQYPVE
ncbi:hypothetical protein GF406_16605 [candidate division KSB1 bacterium]|jgi:hypothetical protein|nr:hypothetical protein [candidate division KSB1 bacterium]